MNQLSQSDSHEIMNALRDVIKEENKLRFSFKKNRMRDGEENNQKVENSTDYSTYTQNQKEYEEKRAEQIHDTTRNLRLKKLDVFPESEMGGIMGMTILGWDWMALRTDQVYDQDTIVHELGHTNDEYETRVLTRWMLSKNIGYSLDFGKYN